jgi:anti-sigma B factor antagonist
MLDVRRVPDADGRVVVVASGQVDLATAPRLAKALAAALGGGAKDIVVDLAAVDFLDSSGVRTLVEAARDARREGATLRLRGAQGWVARVLEITGVEEYLSPPPDPTPDGPR